MSKNKSKNIWHEELKLIIILFIILIVMITLFIYVHYILKKGVKEEADYQYHFIFISKSEDSYTANDIFKEAKEYGKRHGIYVENLNKSTSLNYTVSDYLKMATALDVDGIIVEAYDDVMIRRGINGANEAGIPVITLLSDCPRCYRKSFMELGEYNLGREYGRIIIDIAKTRNPKVMILVDDNEKNQISDIIYGLTETLENEGNHLDVNIIREVVDGSLNFRLMNKVSDIITNDEEKPDIIICLNERDTQIVHQAIVDYSLSGDVQIIGTGISGSLLRSVKDDEFSALVDADAKQAGMTCIDALMKYIQTGEIEDHIIVDDTIVIRENVERYINEY